MSKGIFNPYEAPKKDFRAAVDDNPYDTEHGGPTKGSVKLDGDSYILEFKDAELEDVPVRLGELIYTVIQSYRTHMLQHGINLVSLDSEHHPEEQEMSLPTPRGHLSVYVDKEKNETEVWRRIAYALHLLPLKETLAKHKAKILVR